MSDLSFFNVLAMSPDMSNPADVSHSSHAFSTPRAISLSKNFILSSAPTYSNSEQASNIQVSSSQFTMNSFANGPESFQLPSNVPSSNHSNITTNNNQSIRNLQNFLQNHQNPVYHTNHSSFNDSKLVLQNLPFSNLQPLHQSTTTSNASQEFSYNLSRTAPRYSMANDSTCNSLLLVSSSSWGGTTPLATQDLNRVHNNNAASIPAVQGEHCLASSRVCQERSVSQEFSRTTEPNPTSLSSKLPSSSPDAQLPQTAEETCVRAHSTSSAVTESPSPQVSDLGSEDTNICVSQQSLAQSYSSLTPWTSKLTSPGYIPIAQPTPEAMPIPLESINKEYMLAISPSALESPAHSHRQRVYQGYSCLQPGAMTGAYNNPSYGKTIKDVAVGKSVLAQKSHFKVLPNKEHRFKRTVDALQKSGLWEVAMKTGNLIKRNQELQKELEQFRSDALTFLKSVIKNPQNRDLIKNVLNSALVSNAAPRNGSSVMTVVVSAAASVRLDSNISPDGSTRV